MSRPAPEPGLGRFAAPFAVALILLAGELPASAQTFQEEMAQRLHEPPATNERALTTHLALGEFYRAREFAPLWLDGGVMNPKARTLAAVLKRSDEHGLRPEDYLEPVREAAGGGLAALEVALSRTLVRFGWDLAHGRIEPDAVDVGFDIQLEPLDVDALLAAAAGPGELTRILAGLAPASDSYEKLRVALAQLRHQAAAGARPGLPPGEILEFGMAGPAVTALRDLLRATGDLPADVDGLPESDPVEPAGAYFGRALEAAVIRFQTRHGLEPDGRVGPRTRAALGTPLAVRIEQIEVNLERLRWMNGDLGERHVMVNLADFALEVVDRGERLFAARVVVGAPYHRTPVFSGDMTYIEINPYWNVPPSIARNEILPAVQADPTYLVREDFEVLSDWSHEAQVLDPSLIDWRAVEPDQLSFKFRQRPGPRNALGRIKFMFPNRFNVYLHDTPARTLFSQRVRSFSHGCIRVEQPEVLANLLLDQAGWDRAMIDAAIAADERQVVRLEQPVPVHLTYLTSWVDDAGRLQFRDDIYARDEALRAAIEGAS